MPRSIAVLIILAILLIGGCVFLGMRVKEVPTKTIEVEVNQGANAQ
ncbi:MAG: hypothetical protein ABIQ32_10925 [Sphingomicrobium sp.]